MKFSLFYNCVKTAVSLQFHQANLPDCLTDEYKEECKQIVIEHTIIKTLYNYYKENSSRHSLKHHMELDNTSNVFSNVDKENPEYNGRLYYFKKYARKKDTQKYKLSNPLTKPLYKDLYHIDANLKGHNISEALYTELINCSNYKIFDYIENGRILDVKKTPNTELTNALQPLMSKESEIYLNILTNYEQDEHKHFKRCMDLYSMEINCHFEMNYIIAKKLKKITLAEERKKELRGFEKIHHFSLVNANRITYRFQNFLVKDIDKLLSVYGYPQFSADDVYNLFHTLNYIISNISTSILDIGILSDEFEFPDDECFFYNFIGNGQHIQEKNINDINLRDFRKLF